MKRLPARLVRIERQREKGLNAELEVLLKALWAGAADGPQAVFCIVREIAGKTEAIKICEQIGGPA